jgi:hypothetical protein
MELAVNPEKFVSPSECLQNGGFRDIFKMVDLATAELWAGIAAGLTRAIAL